MKEIIDVAEIANIVEPDLIMNKELRKGLKFCQDRIKKMKNSSREKLLEAINDSLMFESFCFCNLYIYISKGNEKINYGKLRAINYLPKLESLANKHPDLRVCLENYLSTLKEFAEKDENIRELYELYEQSFGGKEKWARI